MIAEIVYILCAATSFLSAFLLYRGYLRTHNRLLFWSSFCFAGFFLNNLLVFVDLVIVPVELSLAIPRIVPAMLGLAGLLFGLVWETK
jgi:hypothetical protein